MKIFISASQNDKKYVDSISDGLKGHGHEIIRETKNIKAGDNLLRRISDITEGVDVILIVITKSFLNSKFALKEIESIIVSEISNEQTRIIPLVTDNSVPPSYLMNYQFVDFSRGFSLGMDQLTGMLTEGASLIGKEEETLISDLSHRNESFINKLIKSLKSGELTLVCGAGVSIGANIPSWNDLLVDLLESMIAKISKSEPLSLRDVNKSSYKSILGNSSPVMGKYLKSNLGKEFLPEVRDALYRKNPITCDLVEAIVELSRPQRDGKPLDSIITFNFDALIEENLERNNIKYKAIDNEGIRNSSDELPIYHVHGYLPRTGKIGPNKNIVFSEDSYHTQFIEPFSWSNLIQLNKLSQNTCLFIGLSLSDPNLRRLLDVANRKDPTNNLNHYIIKKTPNVPNSSKKIDTLMKFLEEQDANELGLNVIWVDEFDQIGDLIRQLIH